MQYICARSPEEATSGTRRVLNCATDTHSYLIVQVNSRIHLAGSSAGTDVDLHQAVTGSADVNLGQAVTGSANVNLGQAVTAVSTGNPRRTSTRSLWMNIFFFFFFFLKNNVVNSATDTLERLQHNRSSRRHSAIAFLYFAPTF